MSFLLDGGLQLHRTFIFTLQHSVSPFMWRVFIYSYSTLMELGSALYLRHHLLGANSKSN